MTFNLIISKVTLDGEKSIFGGLLFGLFVVVFLPFCVSHATTPREREFQLGLPDCLTRDGLDNQLKKEGSREGDEKEDTKVVLSKLFQSSFIRRTNRRWNIYIFKNLIDYFCALKRILWIFKR